MTAEPIRADSDVILIAFTFCAGIVRHAEMLVSVNRRSIHIQDFSKHALIAINKIRLLLHGHFLSNSAHAVGLELPTGLLAQKDPSTFGVPLPLP